MPQHFQQAFLRADLLSAYQMRAVARWSWGVLRHDFDSRAWGQGAVSLTGLEAILPDGTVVRVPDPAFPAPLAVPLDQTDPTRRSWLVWLALPLGAARLGLMPGGATAADLARFRVAEQAGVGDALTGEGEASLLRLEPNVRLWVGDQLPPAFTGFPLVRVLRTADGFRPDPAFLPPALRLSALPPLQERCRRLCSDLRAQANRLVAQAGGGVTAFTTASVREVQTMAVTLGSCLPVLEALVLDDDPHPRMLHLALLEAAGRLAALRDALIPPPFSAYDHDNPAQSVMDVLGFLEETLYGLGQSSRVVRFTPAEEGFRLAGSTVPSSGTGRMVIAVTCPQGVEEFAVDRWMQTATVCGRMRLDLARSHRLLGLRRDRIDRDPSLGLEARRGTLLFAVTGDAGWFREEDALMISNRAPDQEGRPEEIVLHLPLEQRRAETGRLRGRLRPEEGAGREPPEEKGGHDRPARQQDGGYDRGYGGPFAAPEVPAGFAPPPPPLMPEPPPYAESPPYTEPSPYAAPRPWSGPERPEPRFPPPFPSSFPPGETR